MISHFHKQQNCSTVVHLQIHTLTSKHNVNLLVVGIARIWIFCLFCFILLSALCFQCPYTLCQFNSPVFPQLLPHLILVVCPQVYLITPHQFHFIFCFSCSPPCWSIVLSMPAMVLLFAPPFPFLCFQIFSLCKYFCCSLSTFILVINIFFDF